MRWHLSSFFCVICIAPNVASFNLTISKNQKKLEDEYIKHYGNNIYIQREWTAMRELFFAQNMEGMKRFCVEFHKIAGNGELEVNKLLVGFNINVLRYLGTNHKKFARIDVVKYAVNETRVEMLDEFDEYDPGGEIPLTKYLYITRGLGDDCIYYLTPTDDTCMEFYLSSHICRPKSTATKSRAVKKNNVTSNE